ncbi:MAG TPA: CBS domain-containing protein [Chloroflexota bacterium]|nr:CBS domain-containing protein [Chloroflexota bacterium]
MSPRDQEQANNFTNRLRHGLARRRERPGGVPNLRLVEGSTILFYLSEVLDSPVLSPNGERLGTLKDLIVQVGGESFPKVKGLVVAVGRIPAPVYLPWDSVDTIRPDAVRLVTTRLDLRPFARRDGEVLLAKDILDKQIVDVAGRRVVRVNDTQLAQYGRTLRLVAADVSAAGFLGRVLPRSLVEGRFQRQLISWSQVEFFASEVPQVKLSIPHDKIARLHPADIAELVQELAYPQASEVLASLGGDLAADTVEELEPSLSTAIISSLPPAEAADILDEMDPDDAADLLAELPAAQAEGLLKEMEADEAAQVQRLLTYEEDSAGGMMTTDVIAMPRGLTVHQVLARLRQMEDLPEEIFYIYVVDVEPGGRLVGVLTIRHLVSSSPDALVTDVMTRDPIRARVNDPADEVARTIAHYNLLALPVVDEEDHLLGVVTVDDAIDVILPEEWQRRLPKLFR